MSSESLISDPEKIPTAEDATPRTSEQVAASPSIVPESHEEIPHSSEGPAKPILLGDDGDSSESIDGATLNEIRSSIHTISNGVEELATTVQDLLGLSDSDSSGYEYDTQGQALFSWAKFRSRAKRRRHSRRQRKALGIGQLNGAKHDTESDGEISKKPRKTIPEIRECNFKQFQYRPAGDKLYCVDVLIAGDSLDDDIQAFEKTFDKMKSGMIEYVSDWMTESASEDGDEKWIRRIRINSRVVLETLQCVCPETKGFRSRPVVLHRPFQLLVSLHEEIKQQLNNLKGRPSDDLDEKEEGLEKPLNLSVVRDHDSGDFFQKLGEDEDALNELTCFMDFMESRIMPGARRYRDQSSPLPDTIRYEDLWYLFKPGDLVYVTRDTSGRDRFRATSSSHQVVRIIQTCLTSTSSIIPPMGMIYEPSWSFITHFIEHDGTCYSPRNFIFPPIPPFRGKMKVTDLVLYPVSYLQNDEIIAQAQSNGSSYVSLVERRSGYYSGWTRTIDPGGNRIMNNSSENRGSSPEHIESDILVDFEETFNAFPEWKPKFYFGLAADWKVRMDLHVPEQSELPVLGWDEEGRIRFEHFEQVLTRDMTEVNEGKRFLLEDPLGQFRKDMRKTPTGKFLSLVPSRFFAYAVLHRKFVQLDTRFVRSADLEANNQAFDKLEINRNYKRLILALVKSHFDKVETEKKTNVEIETQDLIRGKGKGVVILLHGVPGVGKTATAEAVALKWKKPLFPITCGDLGYSAEALEKSLNEIFRLAHHWGCILLLDEADVFITQRERQDLKRNALVSAFLRVLEYYNGIMFLTTNRAGVLDEAVKSRVHLNLHYDHLNEEQTVAIFKQHIQRLRDIEKQRNPDQNEQIKVLHKEIIQFARDHFNKRDNSHGPGSNLGRWNGRQIRNAFLIASSLAHYDSEDEGDDEDEDELAEPGRKKQKQLGRSQFELVAQTTLMYDQYREWVHSGKSDDHVAFEREERAMSSQPRSPTPVRMKNIGKSLS